MKFILSISLLYSIATLGNGIPLLNRQEERIVPISLSPGNVNLETYYLDKYRDNDSKNPPPTWLNINDQQPSIPIVQPINYEGVGETELLNREKREPQHGKGHYGHSGHYGGHHGGHHY